MGGRSWLEEEYKKNHHWGIYVWYSTKKTNATSVLISHLVNDTKKSDTVSLWFLVSDLHLDSL